MTAFLKIVGFLLAFSGASAHGAPILVVSSGYDTCPVPTTPVTAHLTGYAFPLRQQIAQARHLAATDIPWVASCYRKINRSQAQLLVQSNRAVDTSSLAAAVSHIAGSSHEIPEIIFVGHSWGGMLAIDTVVRVRAQLNQWSLRPGYQHLASARLSLTTIDPIDYNFCTPPPIRNLGNTDCRSAPRSLQFNGWALQRQVYGSVKSWTNIYQNDARWLHSGPVAGLDSGSPMFNNAWLRYSAGSKPHTAIVRDGRTWQLIRSQITGFLR